MADRFDYYYVDPCDRSLSDVAERFHVTPDAIRTAPVGKMRRLVESFVGLDDGALLQIPTKEAEWLIPEDGACWEEWSFSPADTLQRVFDVLANGSPIGKLVTTWNHLDNRHLYAGTNPQVSTWSFVWYYYKNRFLRRDTLKANGVRDEDVSTFSTLPLDGTYRKTIWVPVQPPRRVVVPAAPSDPNNPQTGATVDVQANQRFNVLVQKLSTIEAALDLVDIRRADLLEIDKQGEEVRDAFRKLRASMADRIAAYEWAVSEAHRNNKPRPTTPEEMAARARGLDAIDALIAKADHETVGKPTWRAFDGKGTSFVETYEGKLLKATKAVQSRISQPELMALIAEVCPDMYDAPVLDRSKRKFYLYDYVCGLAARAVAALADSPPEDPATHPAGPTEGLALLHKVADRFDPSKLAGSGCANLVEYACLSANGFDVPATFGRPANFKAPSDSGHRVLGLVIAAGLLRETGEIANLMREADESPEKRSALEAAIRAVANAALNKALGKSRKLLEALELVKTADPPGAVASAFEKTLSLVARVKGAVALGHEVLELKKYDADVQKGFLKALLSPLEGSPAPSLSSRLIPKSMGGLATILGTLSKLGATGSEIVESSEKGDGKPGLQTAGAAVEITKSLLEVSKTTLEGAKALKLFATNAEGELLAFGEGAEQIIKAIGPGSLVCSAFIEGVEAIDAKERGDRLEALGHVWGCEGYLMLFMASTVVDAPALVAVGTALVVSDAVLTKGQFVFDVIEGETVAQFNVIAKGNPRGEGGGEPSKDDERLHEWVADWSDNFHFKGELDLFVAAFSGGKWDALRTTGAKAAALPDGPIGP